MKKVLISLTEEQYQRLEALSAKMGISKSEAMRIAVKMFDVFRTSEEKGEEWKRKSPSGEEIVVKFLS